MTDIPIVELTGDDLENARRFSDVGQDDEAQFLVLMDIAKSLRVISGREQASTGSDAGFSKMTAELS